MTGFPLRASAFAATIGLAALACSVEPLDFEGRSCITDTECRGLLCVQGVCGGTELPGGGGSAGNGGGGIGSGGAGGGGTVPCSLPVDCPDGQVCRLAVGQCVPDCREPGNPCPADRPTCRSDLGVCDPAGGTCTTAADCGPGQRCCAAPMPCDGLCVPDCREAGSSCQAAHPDCDPATGYCGP